MPAPADNLEGQQTPTPAQSIHGWDVPTWSIDGIQFANIAFEDRADMHKIRIDQGRIQGGVVKRGQANQRVQVILINEVVPPGTAVFVVVQEGRVRGIRCCCERKLGPDFKQRLVLDLSRGQPEFSAWRKINEPVPVEVADEVHRIDAEIVSQILNGRNIAVDHLIVNQEAAAGIRADGDGRSA